MQTLLEYFCSFLIFFILFVANLQSTLSMKGIFRNVVCLLVKTQEKETNYNDCNTEESVGMGSTCAINWNPRWNYRRWWHIEIPSPRGEPVKSNGVIGWQKCYNATLPAQLLIPAVHLHRIAPRVVHESGKSLRNKVLTFRVAAPNCVRLTPFNEI
jgi:hypothetical protein